jgi:hypothetical protein
MPRWSLFPRNDVLDLERDLQEEAENLKVPLYKRVIGDVSFVENCSTVSNFFISPVLNSCADSTYSGVLSDTPNGSTYVLRFVDLRVSVNFPAVPGTTPGSANFVEEYCRVQLVLSSATNHLSSGSYVETGSDVTNMNMLLDPSRRSLNQIVYDSDTQHDPPSWAMESHQPGSTVAGWTLASGTGTWAGHALPASQPRLYKDSQMFQFDFSFPCDLEVRTEANTPPAPNTVYPALQFVIAVAGAPGPCQVSYLTVLTFQDV